MTDDSAGIEIETRYKLKDATDGQKHEGWLKRLLPKSLFGRSLIIVIAPMVLLQSVLTFVFLERHWQLVTQRMSESVARDVAAIIAMIEEFPESNRDEQVARIAQETMGLRVDILPPDPLPAPAPRQFFNLLDQTFAREISDAVGKAFWVDTVGNSNLIEVRIRLDDAVVRIFAKRSQAYATNSHIFLVWMVGTSLVLLLVAVLFLRNQIRPIQRLAEAANRFGRGHSISNLTHGGAREVRAASHALVEMSERIEKQIDQRTIMLAGVSHDLRTVITRFRLQLAMMPQSDDKMELEHDIEEMEQMLSDYLAFASGSTKEETARVDLQIELDRIKSQLELQGTPCTVHHSGLAYAELRPNAFRRCLGNIVGNAARYGQSVRITSRFEGNWLAIDIDDDGPGIPIERYDDVFKPFFRLDAARNQDQSGSGLGLAIARDIIHDHGGTITLGEASAGGLRVTMRFPQQIEQNSPDRIAIEAT